MNTEFGENGAAPALRETLDERQQKDAQAARRLTICYIVALSLVAALTIGGQVLIQSALNQQLSDSHVVNIAGRQRMLSQQIGKLALEILACGDSAELPRLRSELQEAGRLWIASHDGLRRGLAELGLPGKNSANIERMYGSIDPHFQAIVQAMNSILQELERRIAAPDLAALAGAIRPAVRQIEAEEGRFLRGMDAIVFRYDLEAERRVAHTQRIELALLLTTLGVLLLEGLLIYRPAVARLLRTLDELYRSRLRLALNEGLRESREQLRSLARNQDKIREQECGRIAREIHDELGQSMTALQLDLNWLKRNMLNGRNGLLEKIEDMHGLVEMTTGSIQRIATDLRPKILDDLGLCAALEWQLAEFRKRSGIACRLERGPGIELHDPELETAIFRAFQEALTNVARHAQATELLINLATDADGLSLEIRDNGAGIAEEKIGDATSLGLIGIRERILPWDGRLSIARGAVAGTVVRIAIPAAAGAAA